MHELSLAEALLQQVRDHTPPGHDVTLVRIGVGPLQAIEPRAMQLAWRAVTQGTAHDGVALRITRLPYRWRCEACGRRWTSREIAFVCACGHDRPGWIGGDELSLEALDVEPQRIAT